MPAISTQHKLDIKNGTRPPRVQITYDVEIGDAIEEIELPFVMGILSDLSGNTRDTPRPSFKERTFYDLDPDTFEDVMAKIQPTYSGKITAGTDAQTMGPDDKEELAYQKAKLAVAIKNDPSQVAAIQQQIDAIESGNGMIATHPDITTDITFQLTFATMDDFSPSSLAKRIPTVQDLVSERRALADLLAKLDGNDALNKTLLSLAGDPARLAPIAQYNESKKATV